MLHAFSFFSNNDLKLSVEVLRGLDGVEFETDEVLRLIFLETNEDSVLKLFTDELDKRKTPYGSGSVSLDSLITPTGF